jgi:hypothetical protein
VATAVFEAKRQYAEIEPELWVDQEALWCKLSAALVEYASNLRDATRPAKRKGGPGRKPGWGVQPQEVLALVEELRAARARGEDVPAVITRPMLAKAVGCSLSAVKRACRKAGLHGHIS